MSKLKTKKQLQKILKDAKSNGKTVGLVTGSFTKIVQNHELLFNFAKKNADILVVATGNDLVVCQIKNTGFPTFSDRIKALTQFNSIDYLFEIEYINIEVPEPVIAVYKQLIDEIKPDFIFTNGSKDKYLKDKQQAVMNTKVKIIDKIT